MDGVELIKHLRDEYPDICTIAMTGYSREYKYMDVLRAGATDFINKPFGIGELEAKLARVIIERNIKKELSFLSITDSLTGLYNQRHFYTRLQEEITRARRQNHPLALILVDLDNFKQYNDDHGHVAGDDLLRKVGRIIRRNIRQGVDSGYRYGGDEFAIVLIDATEDNAKTIGSRIQSAIEEKGQQASTGYAYYMEEMSPEAFVAKADSSLYNAKRLKRGKNTRAG
jgi:two-component system cell cycle response regulator